MDKNKLEWVFLGVITLLLIIITISPARADEHDIYINASGDTQIHIGFNVTTDIENNYYSYKEVKGDREKTINSLAEAFNEATEGKELDRFQYKFVSSVYSFFMNIFAPKIDDIETRLVVCENYMADSYVRDLAYDERIKQLESK